MNRKLQKPGKANLMAPFDLVRPHLKTVESLLSEQVNDFDPGVEPYVDYVCNTSGKRLRPALAILTGGALGPVTDDHVKLGQHPRTHSCGEPRPRRHHRRRRHASQGGHPECQVG